METEIYATADNPVRLVSTIAGRMEVFLSEMFWLLAVLRKDIEYAIINMKKDLCCQARDKKRMTCCSLSASDNMYPTTKDRVAIW